MLLTRASRSLFFRPPLVLLRHASTTTASSNANPVPPPEPLSYNYISDGHTDPDPQIGDYPNLPFNSNQLRDARTFWDKQDRRNFNETLHEQDEVLGVWGPDIYNTNPFKALAQLSAILGILGGFAYYQYLYHPKLPAAVRTYPFNGLKEAFGARDDDIRVRGAKSETSQE